MARFPFNIPAAQPYAGPGGGIRVFGASRDHGHRLHGGCDLYAPIGTPIFAIAAGTVQLEPYAFYLGAWAIEIVHPGIGVVRYGEVLNPNRYSRFQPNLLANFHRSGITDLPRVIEAPRITRGMAITEGQLIAAVGKLDGLPNPMLHFELYQEGARGQSLSGGGRYRRNALLLNPTSLLQRLEQARGGETTAPPAPAVADPAVSHEAAHGPR